MSFIRYKLQNGREYAFLISSYWDKSLKQPRQRSEYLGVVIDKDKQIFEKKHKNNELILDFGDSFAIDESLKNTEILKVIRSSFGELTESLLCLCFNRLTNPTAMRLVDTWYQGNYVNRLFKDVNLSSQRISELLKKLGDEKLLREFFKNYLKTKEGVLDSIAIDTTALPNQVHMPYTAFGHSDSGIEKAIRLIYVVDKNNSSPLYFRYMPGNVSDVSCLLNTVQELKSMGVEKAFALLDAGFFSKDNIEILKNNSVDFLTRLPASRTLYKQLTNKHSGSIEDSKYAFRYGKRMLFVKYEKADYADNLLHCYVILDPERRTKEIIKLLDKSIDLDEVSHTEVNSKMKQKGIFVLVSSSKLKEKEVVSHYYDRQKVEQLFAYSKADLNLTPIRTHSDSTFRGYLLITFISLILYIELKHLLTDKFAMEESLLTLRNLKCKIYGNNLYVQELTKAQKEIYEQLGIIVPKMAGI